MQVFQTYLSVANAINQENNKTLQKILRISNMATINKTI
jgi:hypothetical protein